MSYTEELIMHNHHTLFQMSDSAKMPQYQAVISRYKTPATGQCFTNTETTLTLHFTNRQVQKPNSFGLQNSFLLDPS